MAPAASPASTASPGALVIATIGVADPLHRHDPVDEAERRQAAPGLQLDRPDRLHRPGHRARPSVLRTPDDPALQVLAVVAVVGALYHVLNHAVFKGLLFLTSGSVLYATGTKDLNKLGGLIKLMPVTAVVAGIASLSIAGMPPFSGFASKWTHHLELAPGRDGTLVPGHLRHHRPLHQRRHPGLLRQVLRHGLHLVRARNGPSAEADPRSPRVDARPEDRPGGPLPGAGPLPFPLLRAHRPPCRASEGFLLGRRPRGVRPVASSASVLGIRSDGPFRAVAQRGRRAARRPGSSSSLALHSARCCGGRAGSKEAGADLALRLPGPGRTQPVRRPGHVCRPERPLPLDRRKER